jgi:sortase A
MTSATRRRRIVSRLRHLELVLLLTAIAALGRVVHEQVSSSRDQADWAQELETQLAATTGVPHAAPAAARDAAPRKRAEGAATIGRIEIPRLRLSAITREGADAATLRRAVGHVPSTALPGERGNAAFAGHRDTFFRKLRDVRKGDEIVFTTPEGELRYVVSDLRVVPPSDVSVLEPTEDPVLTLVTCYPFNYIGSAPERFIVRASLRASSGASGLDKMPPFAGGA